MGFRCRGTPMGRTHMPECRCRLQGEHRRCIVVRRADTTAAATASRRTISTSRSAAVPAIRAVRTRHAAAALTRCTPMVAWLHACYIGARSRRSRRIYSGIYYISTCSGIDCSAPGADSVPTLKRIDVTPAGAATPTPIVDGIEDLQFDYGLDTNTDARPPGRPHEHNGARGSNAVVARRVAERHGRSHLHPRAKHRRDARLTGRQDLHAGPRHRTHPGRTCITGATPTASSFDSTIRPDGANEMTSTSARQAAWHW